MTTNERQVGGVAAGELGAIKVDQAAGELNVVAEFIRAAWPDRSERDVPPRRNGTARMDTLRRPGAGPSRR
jgi:hypothetical protein